MAHLPRGGRDKMPTFSQQTLQIHYLYGNCSILIHISLQIILKGPTDNKPSLD